MNKGVYYLIMKLDKAREIAVGRKGPLRFPAGFYCYVGSAMNSLEKRIARHVAREKRMHWHIDWLLEHARIVDVKRIETKRRLKGIDDKLEGIIWLNITDIFQSQTIENLENQFEKKVKNIDKKIDSNPENIDLYYLKIKILLYFNKYQETIKLLDNLLEILLKAKRTSKY